MSSTVEEHLIYRVANAPMQSYPYPHLYVDNVFPADFYAQLRANWPDSTVLASLADSGRVYGGGYGERFVLPFTPSGISKLSVDRRAFWSEFESWFMAERFRETMIEKFETYVQLRFGDNRRYCEFASDSLLVRDRTNYSLGPHSDAPNKLLSMLFYCPDDASMKALGTSIYMPLDPNFRCKGGPHYQREKFQKVITMEYKPNSLFTFFKTTNSFHGVEPIGDAQVQRDILLYDVRVSNPRAEQSESKASSPTGIGLKMLGKLFGGGNK